MSPSRTIAPSAVRALTDVAVALILIAFAAYWWFSPKGFPVDHVRFWLNSVLPVAIVVLCTIMIFIHRRRRAWTGLAILCLALGGGAATIAGSVLFPASLRGFWAIGLFLILAGAYCSGMLVRGERPKVLLWLPSAALAIAVGLFTMVAQIPATASTNPLNELPLVSGAKDGPSVDSPIPLGPDRFFYPSFMNIQGRYGNVRFVYSLPFYFDRISPDGFWSLFAPEANKRNGQLVARLVPELKSRSLSAGVHTVRYADGTTVLLPLSTAERMDITTYVPLARDTFSHINTYCELVIFGHQSLSLSFSPAPETKIDVLPFDYPIGRAARFAYLDETETFSVVEASSGEKGPFRTLAAGILRRGDPLSITCHDQGKPLASITLDDWSQQVSTALSPTAGWGVPVNAIEFRRMEDDPDSPVVISVTLAGTSVRRGWDSVGHRAGIYRNRMRIEFATE
jgi:hypothetical protein